MYIGWTTVASAEDAERLAREAVEHRLAVCAQVDGPIRSLYLWEEKVENVEEYRISFKFLAENSERIESWLQENHTYEVPQWLAVRVERVMSGYLEWAKTTSLREKAPVPKKDVLRLSKLGRNLLRKNRFQEAEKVFLEALALDEDNPYILVGLGDTCRELKKFEDSIANYERVLKTDPVNVFALRGIGDSYRGILQHKRAIPYWIRYLDCNKDDIYVMVRLAESFNKTGNFEKAEAFYLQALNISPTDKYALLGLGSLYYKAEQDDKALAFFDKLLSLDDSYVAVLTMVGNIYRRRKEFQKAAEFYERATSFESWNSFALYGLGDCQRGLANMEDAVFWWSKILDKEPNNQDLLTRVGDALLSMDRLEQSLDCYMRSLKVGFDLYALLGLSRVYRVQGNSLAAEECCLKILAKVPSHHRTLEELVAIYQATGEVEKLAEAKERLAHADIIHEER